MIYFIASIVGGATLLSLAWLRPWIDDHHEDNRY
jgi:hypothetical protein